MSEIEQELIKVTKFKGSENDHLTRQDYLASLLRHADKFFAKYPDVFETEVSDEAVDWFNEGIIEGMNKKREIPDFPDLELADAGAEPADDDEADEEVDEEADEEAEAEAEADDEVGEDADPEAEAEAPDDSTDVPADASDDADPEAEDEPAELDEAAQAAADTLAESENEAAEAAASSKAVKAKGKGKPKPAPGVAKPPKKAPVAPVKAAKPAPAKPLKGEPERYAKVAVGKKDRFGVYIGTKSHDAVMMYEKGVTMKDLEHRLNGRHRNILRKLAKDGHKVEKLATGAFKLTHKDDIGKSTKKKEQ